MSFTHEVEGMICVASGANHGPAPIPEEGKWVKISGWKDKDIAHGEILDSIERYKNAPEKLYF